MKRTLTVLIFLISTLIFMQMAAPRPSSAAPALQLTDFPTPTPGPDGRILYVVQAGDTLWRIAAVAGLTIDELRGLNNFTADDIIREGQTILLGLGGPSQAEATAAPDEGDAPVVQPTATPLSGPGLGNICILLYDDINGDAIRQETELPIADGAISLADQIGQVSITAETLDAAEIPAEPEFDAEFLPSREEAPVQIPDLETGAVCFPYLSAGAYNITVAIPDGYNPTTFLSFEIELVGGDTTYIDFGAQLSSEGELEVAALPPEEGGTSPALGIIGLALLVSGLGLGIFALFVSRGR
jgi:hypothetical protein